MQHADVIARLGGPRKVADALGIESANTVLYWGRQGRHIPAKFWLAITTMPGAADAGITLEALAAGRATTPAEAA